LRLHVQELAPRRASPNRFAARHRSRAVERANSNRADAGVPPLPEITPHSLRRTWATFAAMVGRDPRWIAAQIGHTSPAFTFSVYQQVATRRYIDEQTVWTLMRFADEPAEHVASRQITRAAPGDPRGYFTPEMGEFDQAMEQLNEADKPANGDDI
jgi:Phage integrase family